MTEIEPPFMDEPQKAEPALSAQIVYTWMGRVDATLKHQTTLLTSIARHDRVQNKRIASLETSRTRLKAGWATTTFILILLFGAIEMKISGLFSSLHNWTVGGPTHP
jgi:hypothetical protein